MPRRKDSTSEPFVRISRFSRNAALRAHLLRESDGHCNVCTAHEFLQVASIRPKPAETAAQAVVVSPAGYIVLCPTCHAGVDRNGVAPELLDSIKADWVDRRIAGKPRILAWLVAMRKPAWWAPAEQPVPTFASALDHSREFDHVILETVREMEETKREDEFLNGPLKRLFEALGFDGVTVLHHTGQMELGKDMVFHDRDRLGALTWYVVVACIGDVHANSARTGTPGHYRKIQDQIEKCFLQGYHSHDLKGVFHIDRVIVACTGTITPEALAHLGAWEQRERRSLVFLPAARIAGLKAQVFMNWRGPAEGDTGGLARS